MSLWNIFQFLFYEGSSENSTLCIIPLNANISNPRKKEFMKRIFKVNNNLINVLKLCKTILNKDINVVNGMYQFTCINLDNDC